MKDFEDWWDNDDSLMHFPKDGKELKLWCKDAYKAGMLKAAEILESHCDHTLGDSLCQIEEDCCVKLLRERCK